jgi:hypothetical protein
MIGELFLLAYNIFYGIVGLGFTAGLSYIISMGIVDFPSCLIETIIKQKIPEGFRGIIKAIITILLTIYFVSKGSLDIFVL